MKAFAFLAINGKLLTVPGVFFDTFFYPSQLLYILFNKIVLDKSYKNSFIKLIAWSKPRHTPQEFPP